MHVIVIGAGIVGASAALELIRDGHQVTILEAGEPGGRQSASYGHGCWISPASVVPMSMPGLWKQIPSYLLNPKGPLVISWRHIIKLLPWLVRFLIAGSTVARVEKTARALATLLGDSPQRHLKLAEELGLSHLIRQEGLLYAYPGRQDFEAEKLSWHLRSMTGLRWKELDAGQLHAREPHLSNRYNFGVLAQDGAHCVDPGAYVAAIVSAAIARGATLVKARANGFVFDDNSLIAVETDNGRLECDRAVIASGVWSKALARKAGDRIPLEAERGYHGVLVSEENGPSYPVMPSDGKMANTPTSKGLRLSGQVELASVETPPNWKRVDILIEHALATYDHLTPRAAMKLDRWMGHRPSTPDGLPVIGTSSRSNNVFYAFGHGHVGFASGPITGRIVADMVSGKAPTSGIEPFSPRRFA
ncbi:FAD-binding oxidoreductase [Agrobacterium salinitolerans]|uniref:FAD-binding oxidoreductase n=1 Tax=Agrobacterium salinitolerans TaxID=1183413 RepID=A0A9X3KTN9_9HYPH|nr:MULTISPECIES: FAD-binding oxidoreductase [Agrobacterium]MCZ7854954.1 FAD-binding oxidoreductase [Agrobacterium salinitolerans]MCZ7893875.1 FAD-binding oxidoreductase [Agrobacterium salinitolerans]MCZ7940625.1 FAD-binding oxidoreductase [Agrobacterium salinitolerans]TRA84176.1 FAD-binding oxidoreductase [Agrobacterium salinitolerans]